MRRPVAAAVLTVLTGLAVAGCGAGTAAATAGAGGTTTSATASSSAPPPTDCQAASGVGAHDAAFVVQLALSVDYRNLAQLPAVLRPLLTPSFFATYAATLAGQRAAVTAGQVANAVSVSTVGYASGSCAAPTYTVSVVRQTSSTTGGAQSAELGVTAALTWDGSGYLLAALTG